MNLRKLHTLYIQDTKPLAIVVEAEIYLCNLTMTVSKILNPGTPEKMKVYVTTRMLKHLYDKKPAEEYDFVINNAHNVAKYPDDIYKNRDSKRGDYAFVKNINDEPWFCAIERNEEKFYIATCFRLRKESYLNNYTLIWSWKGDTPSS